MIGSELAKAIKNTRGKICINMVSPDGAVWIFAEKSDLIKWAKSIGEGETKMKLFEEENGNGTFLDIDYDRF